MSERPASGFVTRRELLHVCGLGTTAALCRPAPALAQAPKRGGTLTIRAWDPPHFDPYLIIAFKTQVIYSFTQSRFLPDSPRNILKVNDPPLTDLILRQRRLVDLAKRRELIHDIQRHLARQVYRAEAYSTVLMGVWDPALKNYGPNLGFDYGGRLIAAWLDR
jgi:ABC-type transport system substrate-binding protein